MKILFIFVVFYFSCSEKKLVEVEKFNFLDLDFALKQEFPKEQYLNIQEENSFRQEKSIFEKKFYDGVNLYKEKRYTESISKFEDTLKLHSNPEVYYYYAKSLKSVGRFKDSISAFLISEKLGYENKKNLFYNLASVNSLDKNLPESVFYLKKSIENGFKEFNLIKKDISFEFVKKNKNWNLILENIQSNKFLTKNQTHFLQNPNLKIVLKNDSKKILSNSKEKISNSQVILFNGIIFYSEKFFDEDDYFFEVTKTGNFEIVKNKIELNLSNVKINTNHPNKEMITKLTNPQILELEFKKEINGFVFKNDFDLIEKDFVVNKTECVFIKEINCEDCLREYIQKGYFCSK